MKTLLLSALLLTGLVGCSKKEDAAPATPTDWLTAKSWRISAVTLSTMVTGIPTPIVQDGYVGMQACERDNFVKFNTDKSTTFDEGATKCSSTDPQTRAGSWNLDAANTKLTLTEPRPGVPTSITYDVVTLSATTLTISYAYTYSIGTTPATHTVTTTFNAF